MTHILHVVDLLQVGGAQKLIAYFSQAARRRGVQVSVVSLADTSGKIAAEELAALGVPVTAFPARHLADLGRILALVRYLRSQPFDLVQTHLTYANILGGLAGRMAGLPVIATLHSSGNDQNPTGLSDFSSPRSRAETFALRHFADRIMAVGESVAQAQQARVPNQPIDMIVNAVPLPAPLLSAERQARRAQLAVADGQPLLISAGRFAPVKELPELIAAFGNVKKRHPEAKLLLIGDGSERARVEALIASLQLNQDVILLGRRSDVSAWLQSSDVFVSASSLEGLPVSILEAMAAGLPVVATEVGDVPRIVQPEMGSLVPAHQPDQLANAICTLLDDQQRQRNFGAAAQAYVAKNFDLATWFDRIMALYGTVMKPSGKEPRAGQVGL